MYNSTTWKQQIQFSDCKTLEIGGTLKMGQQTPCTCGTIEAEATMPCTTCPNKSTSVIKTPHGYICPDCYKRLYLIKAKVA